MEQEKPNIQIVDKTRPRVAIEIVEMIYDPRKKVRKRQGRKHMTVYGLSSADAHRIIAAALKAAGQ